MFQLFTRFFRPWCQPRRTTHLYPIKGTFYYEADQVEASGRLRIGTALVLQAEPDNAYDPFALQVFYPLPNRLALLGYMPRQDTARIHFWLAHQRIHRITLETAYREYQRLYLYLAIEADTYWWEAFRRWRNLAR